MTLDEILILLNKAKEAGVQCLDLTLAGEKICLQFPSAPLSVPVGSFLYPPQPQAPLAPPSNIKIEDIFKPPAHLSDDILNDPEKVKYYATPYFDEIEAKAKAHEEKLQNESK